MTLISLQHDIASILAADEWLLIHHVSALAENIGDIEQEIAAAVGKTGIVAIIVTPEFKPESQDGTELAGTAALRIMFYEQPLINRSRAGYATALAAAEYVMQLSLNWPATTIEMLQQAPVDDDQGGLSVELSLQVHIVHKPTQ